VADAIEA
jgi:hypothetical protein